VAKRNGHTSFYLACGAADAPLIIFVHGWPELSRSWRHQLPVFCSLGLSRNRARYVGLRSLNGLYAAWGLHGPPRRI